MAIVLNLLNILLATSLVQRSLTLEKVVKLRDDRQAEERSDDRVLSPIESPMYKGHSETRTASARNNPSKSDGIQKYGSIMEYLTPEETDVNMSSLRYLHMQSSQKAQKSRTQKHVKTDSLAQRPHPHRNTELKQMGHTSTALMDTRFEGDQHTSLTGLRSGHVKSLQIGPFRENSASYPKEKLKINSAGSNVRDCSVQGCDRQLCPWTLKWNTQHNRSPIHVLYASCESTTCDFEGFLVFVLRHGTEFDTVVKDIQVYVDDKPTNQPFPVACICRYKYRRQVPSYSSNVQSHADHLKTGPMTHTVKLGELEMIDGTEPEILTPDLPVRHRKRKLRQHHGKESSDQQEDTEETKFITQP